MANTLPAESVSPSVSDYLKQQHRRKRLMAIINDGLPAFPNTVLELTAIFNKPTVDVKKAGRVIRADPSLSAQVLRVCNSPLFGLRNRVTSIEQATVLIGTERLRSIAITCSLVDYSGSSLPREQVMNFWQHSFLAAMLTELLAKHTGYAEKEQAYLAGLLHDIGQLPQWMIEAEEKKDRKLAPSEKWPDNPALELEHFGMDHCVIGACIGVSWNFDPALIDVIGHHHEPKGAQHDALLVAVVAAVENFLLRKAKAVAEAEADAGSGEPAGSVEAMVRLPSLSEEETREVAGAMEREYARLLPLVESGLTAAIGAGR